MPADATMEEQVENKILNARYNINVHKHSSYYLYA
jgi:hypothetical protein